MTTANVNVTKVLLKRGNTVQNNNYTGVSGELTIDTQLKTLRVHDGVTAGGNAITALGAIGSYSNTNTAAYLASQSITSANIGAFQTLANANAATQATSIDSINANVGAYQTFANANAATQATSIDSINANIGAFQTLANANAATQTTEINSLRANITAANTAITSLTSNAAIQATLLDTLTGNAVTQSQVLDTLTSNAAAQATSLTTLLGNAVAQQTSLIDLVANAATQAQAIASVTGTYSNANVATYLSAFDGNILPSANVTYSLGSETRQWRDLWVSNNTIYIGNTPVRVDGGTLLVNGAPVGGSYNNANVAAYLPSYTGNITAGNIGITGSSLTWANASIVQTSASDVSITGDGQVTVRSLDGTYQWTFESTGNLTLPGSIIGASTIELDNRAYGNSADINLYAADDILLQARDRTLGSTSEGGDINIFAGDSAEDGDSSGGDVTIRAGDGGAGNVDFGGSGGTITIQSGQGGAATGNSGYSAESGGALTLGAGDAGSNNGNIDLGAAGGDVYIGAGDSTGNTDDGGGIYITSGAAGTNALAGQIQLTIPPSDSGSGGVWIFDGYGNLRVPGNINFSNGVSILAGITGTYGNANVAAYLPTYTGNIAGNIVKNGNVWTFGNTGTTTFPTNISIDYSAGNVQYPRIIADTGKAFSVQAQGNIGSAALSWTVNPDAAGQYAAVAVTKGGGDNLAKVVLTAQSDSGDVYTAKTWQFNQTGTTQFPGGTILAPAGQNITMQSDQYSQLMWENANLTVAPNMAINSNFYVTQNNATLDIGYRDGSSTQLIKTWLWNIDGMTLPEGGVIAEGGGISGAIRLTPAGGANSNQALLIYPTGNAEGDHVHLTAGGGSTELYLGNDFHYVKLVDGGNIELRAATANLSSQAAWTFDTTGNVDTIQALGIKVPNGVPSNVAVINSTTGSWESNPRSNLATTGGSGSGLTVNVTETGGYASTIAIATAGTGYTNGDLITVTSGTSNATFTIVIAGRNTWRFGTDGVLTAPNIVIAGNTNLFGSYTALIQPTNNLPIATISSGTAGGITSVWVEDLGDIANSNIAAIYTPLAGTGTVRVAAGSNATSVNLWDFNPDGNLILPESGYLKVGSGIVAGFASSPAPIISGFSSVSAENFRFQGNGVNILSAVGAGAYGNTQVASYLLHFDGDIEFTSSTAKIGNVDVITVGDHIRSPAYQFSNGTSILAGITGTYSNTNVAAYLTTANISTTGNITAGNLITTGTFTVANITTTGTYGNITGANVISANTVSATNYLFANGVNILSTVTAGSTYSNTNVAAYLTTANISTTGNITAGNVSATRYNFANGANILANVVTKVTGSWTVTTGTNTYSIQLAENGTYQIWVDCNIPNGILAYNATATVTNGNVPVVGVQYAWVYSGGGTPIDFVSIPNQFTGTANTIVRSSVAPSATTNRFDFGINNTSGGNVTVRYGWVAIS